MIPKFSQSIPQVRRHDSGFLWAGKVDGMRAGAGKKPV